MGQCASAEGHDAIAKSKQANNTEEVTAAARSPSPERSAGQLCVLSSVEDVRNRYAFEKVLGKGQFGVTRLVVDKATGEQCACKSISKRKLVNECEVEDVRREIKILHHLSGHPHVVGFKGAYEDHYHVHLCMELCSGGDGRHLQASARRERKQSGPHCLYWHELAIHCAACTGGELFQQISAKGHYHEKDAAHLMRTILQACWARAHGGALHGAARGAEPPSGPRHLLFSSGQCQAPHCSYEGWKMCP
jgi:hypothetical protein